MLHIFRPLKRGVGQLRYFSVKVSTDYYGRALSLETGEIGPFANRVVFGKYGGTSVLASVVSSFQLSEENSLPLQVEYRERAFAYNLIPDGRSRREGGGSDREVLIGRVVDRSLRPLFREGYFYDTQVIVTLLSHDRDCDPTMVSVLAASASLHASSVPWDGPAACVRMGWSGDSPLVSPSMSTLLSSDNKLDLLYSGAGAGRALMLELGARQLPEASVAVALEASQVALAPLLTLQQDFATQVACKKRDCPLMIPSDALNQAIEAAVFDEAIATFKQLAGNKAMRSRAQGQLIKKAITRVKELGSLSDGEPIEPRKLDLGAQSVVKRALREAVLQGATVGGVAPLRALGGAVQHERDSEKDSKMNVNGSHAQTELLLLEIPEGLRIDGRGGREVRPLSSRVDVLPSVHGSALFSRGDTQVLAAVTLGPVDSVLLDAPGPAYLPPPQPLSGTPLRLNGEAGSGGTSDEGGGRAGRVFEGGDSTLFPPRTFFLHYDFPPYATNEVGKVGGGAANRRTVGHGALGEKALSTVIPPVTTFPYAIRVLGETTGSDGSSSMATVCAATLALLDAGVPIAAPVAGVSIGCFSSQGQGGVGGPSYALLTDILGLEDYAGDMDFKVAGTSTGVTAVQLDVKVPVPLKLIFAALPRAADARSVILNEIQNCASSSWASKVGSSTLSLQRPTLKPSAPSVELMDLPPELRSRLIGPGGSNIRRIESLSGATLVLDTDSTKLSIYGSPHALAAANALITSSVSESLRSSGSPLSLSLKGPPGAAPESSFNGGCVNFPRLTVGVPITARVSKINEYGVVLEVENAGVLAGTPEAELGWMHISDICKTRIMKVSDVLSEGDVVKVMTFDIDSRGRGRFSLKALMRNGDVPESFITKNTAASSHSSGNSPALTTPKMSPVSLNANVTTSSTNSTHNSSANKHPSSSPTQLSSTLKNLDASLSAIQSILVGLRGSPTLHPQTNTPKTPRPGVNNPRKEDIKGGFTGSAAAVVEHSTTPPSEKPRVEGVFPGAVMNVRVASFENLHANLESTSESPYPVGKLHPPFLEFGLQVGDIIRARVRHVTSSGQGSFTIKDLPPFKDRATQEKRDRNILSESDRGGSTKKNQGIYARNATAVITPSAKINQSPLESIDESVRISSEPKDTSSTLPIKNPSIVVSPEATGSTTPLPPASPEATDSTTPSPPVFPEVTDSTASLPPVSLVDDSSVLTTDSETVKKEGKVRTKKSASKNHGSSPPSPKKRKLSVASSSNDSEVPVSDDPPPVKTAIIAGDAMAQESGAPVVKKSARGRPKRLKEEPIQGSLELAPPHLMKK